MTQGAWRDMLPGDYDAHMSHPNVAQTQMLGRIFREQFALCPHARAAILGITNGHDQHGRKHYEETVSVGKGAATVIAETWKEMLERIRA